MTAAASTSIQQGLIASTREVATLADRPLEAKLRDAIEAVKRQIGFGRHLTVAWSGGKDSSVTLAITLQAMRGLVSEGRQVPTLHVVHADTLMENPVVVAYNQRQIRQIKRYAKEKAIPLRVWIASPGLSNDYLVSVIGGRSIISVGGSTKCQQMTKAYPLDRLKRKVRRHIAAEDGVKPGEVEIVSLIGTRFDESAARKRAMESRAESAIEAVDAMGDGQLVLSPIAHFSQMDVFEFIGHVRSERIECYDSWDELVELYKNMNGGDCMVVAYLAGREQENTPCNARTGCWTCARVARDTSAESLIATEGGKFAWMKPLNDFRQFMIDHHFNPSARAWLARNVGQDGYIDVVPNAYSPEHCRKMLEIALSIQANEEDEARRLRIQPRFTLLTLKQVMAIELNWGRYGYQEPWTAMRIWKDVYQNGKRFQIPDRPQSVFTSKDVAFKARVPFADSQYNDLFSGLRNVDAAAADCEDLTLTNDGRYVTRCVVGGEYDIDDEGLELFMMFELDRVLQSSRLNSTPSAAIHYLQGLGTVQLYKGSHRDWDRMLRVSNQLYRHGLGPILNDPHAIVERLSVKQGMIRARQQQNEAMYQQENLF